MVRGHSQGLLQSPGGLSDGDPAWNPNVPHDQKNGVVLF